MFHVVTRKFGDPVYHFEHFWDYLLQELCFLAYDFICYLVRQRQNALQPVEKARWHLVVFILFLQELSVQVLPLFPLHQQRARTWNVTLATPKKAFAIGFN